MAVATQVSVEEYLKTVYRPDRDYVDGVVEERNLGQLDHSLVQARLIGSIMRQSREILPLPEWRFQITPTRFRVPDVTVVSGRPSEQILTKAPLLCVEILSPEDRISRVNVRIQEYLDFGVPVVWLIDPEDKTIWIYRSSGMVQAPGPSIKLDGTSIEVPFVEIFE